MSNSGYVRVQSYLKRLDEALRNVPKDRRREIVDEIEAHIHEEIRQLGPTPTDAAIAQILDRVGDPEEIAADAGPGDESAARVSRLGILEVAALVLLLVGGFILFPFVGWIAGVVLLWVSPAWTTPQKLLGTFVVPGGLALPFFLNFFAWGGTVCEIRSHTVVRPNGKHKFIDRGPSICESTGPPSWLMPALMVILVIAAIATAIYLGRKARKPAVA